jgi:quinol monooxygenase YgiN
MILRIFKVTVHEGRVDQFRDFFLNTAIPLMRRTPGLDTLLPGLPRPEAPQTFCMVMAWRDLDALKAFVGEDWTTPHIHPDEEGIVKHRSLDHFDLVTD